MQILCNVTFAQDIVKIIALLLKNPQNKDVKHTKVIYYKNFLDIPYGGMVCWAQKGGLLVNCKNDCGQCENRNTVRRPAKLTKDLSSRLNRIEGQVKGIKSMVEKEVYCDDVLTQIAAASSALSSVAKLLLESHMRGCVSERLKSGDDEVINELIKTVGRLL